MMMSDIITLNVGGHMYQTSRATLSSYPDSRLGLMFRDKVIQLDLDKNGNCFIDRDGNIFQHVLNFLRTSRLVLPKNFVDYDLLKAEADFYEIPELIDALKEKMLEQRKPDLNVTRRTLIKRDAITGTTISSDEWAITGDYQANIFIYDCVIKSEENNLRSIESCIPGANPSGMYYNKVYPGAFNNLGVDASFQGYSTLLLKRKQSSPLTEDQLEHYIIGQLFRLGYRLFNTLETFYGGEISSEFHFKLTGNTGQYVQPNEIGSGD